MEYNRNNREQEVRKIVDNFVRGMVGKGTPQDVVEKMIEAAIERVLTIEGFKNKALSRREVQEIAYFIENYDDYIAQEKERRNNMRESKLIKKALKESIRKLLKEDEKWAGDINPRVTQSYRKDLLDNSIKEYTMKIDEYSDKMREYAKSGHINQVENYCEQIKTLTKLIQDYKLEMI